MSTDLPWLARWLSDPVAEDFPYPAVVSEFQRVGKQRVHPRLLDALAKVRANHAGDPRITRFLNVALDKYDGRYDYTTYLAIELFPDPDKETGDRVITDLVADALAFELAALDHADVPLPRMRPDEKTVGKRLRHGLRVIAPFAARIGGPTIPDGDPVDAARVVCAAIEASRPPEEAHLLRTTMLPVDTIHDEYLFIRVLQSFEMFFAVAARQLAAVPGILDSGDVPRAADILDGVSDLFDETAPLFSMLATMRAEAFRTFRRHTEGASAIQSSSYKRMESLSSRPEPERLASAAYESVPVVRDEVLDNRRTIDDALADLDPEPPDAARITAAQRRFATSHRRWRRTHHRLAVRMLADETGSGYTAGVPYLASVRDLPVFKT